eukprot:15434975-Alexandrium_andersonii.AAC.1
MFHAPCPFLPRKRKRMPMDTALIRHLALRHVVCRKFASPPRLKIAARAHRVSARLLMHSPPRKQEG